MTARQLPTPLVEFWLCVAAMHKSGSPTEFSEDNGYRMLMRKHRYTARFPLEILAERGYLRTSRPSGLRRVYWFSEQCKVPDGQVRPVEVLPAGTEKAGLREYVNAAMPDDTTPLMRPEAPGPRAAFRECPSRMGNRLRWRDGRVTDLDGVEIKPCN